ncbi:galactokinase [Novosphingobium sp. MW5]|nr:galactokinase [Novosphingobium sp. MW5]
MTLLRRVRDGYLRTYGEMPEGVAFVPGRVNLIGEHVDYNDGLVLPMPISAGTAVAWGRGDAPGVEAVALDLDEERDSFGPGDATPHQPVDWRSYLRGTAAAMAGQGLHASGARLAIAGSIPRGSGLSSSASVCVAIARALAEAGGVQASAETLALAAQSAEHNWAGVRCGIMDQMAVAAGEPGCALLLDCADMSHRNLPLPDDWAVMIVQSGVRRGLVDGHYNRRREDCEAAAKALGLSSLRHADAEAIARANLDPVVTRRAAHVVEEISRVAQAASAIEQRDLTRLGDLMRASHASLRDQFEVSEAHVDRLVDLLGHAIGSEGGARMTGGGFGGAVVAVMPSSQTNRVRARIEEDYAPPSGAPLEIMIEQTGRVLAGECE